MKYTSFILVLLLSSSMFIGISHAKPNIIMMNENNKNSVVLNDVNELSYGFDIWHNSTIYEDNGLKLNITMGSPDEVFPNDNYTNFKIILEVENLGDYDWFNLTEINHVLFTADEVTKESNYHLSADAEFNTTNLGTTIEFVQTDRNLTEWFGMEFSSSVIINGELLQGDVVTTYSTPNLILSEATFQENSNLVDFNFPKTSVFRSDLVMEGYRSMEILMENNTHIDFSIGLDQWWYRVVNFDSFLMGFDLEEYGISNPYIVYLYSGRGIDFKPIYNSSKFYMLQHLDTIGSNALKFSVDKPSGNYTTINTELTFNRLVIGIEIDGTVYVEDQNIPIVGTSAFDIYIPNSLDIDIDDQINQYNVSDVETEYEFNNYQFETITAKKSIDSDTSRMNSTISWFKESGYIATLEMEYSVSNRYRSDNYFRTQYRLNITPMFLDDGNPQILSDVDIFNVEDDSSISIETKEKFPSYLILSKVNTIITSRTWESDGMIELNIAPLSTGQHKINLTLVDIFNHISQVEFTIIIETKRTDRTQPDIISSLPIQVSAIFTSFIAVYMLRSWTKTRSH